MEANSFSYSATKDICTNLEIVLDGAHRAATFSFRTTAGWQAQHVQFNNFQPTLSTTLRPSQAKVSYHQGLAKIDFDKIAGPLYFVLLMSEHGGISIDFLHPGGKDVLASIQAAFPNHGVKAEEHGTCYITKTIDQIHDMGMIYPTGGHLGLPSFKTMAGWECKPVPQLDYHNGVTITDGEVELTEGYKAWKRGPVQASVQKIAGDEKVKVTFFSTGSGARVLGYLNAKCDKHLDISLKGQCTFIAPHDYYCT